MEKNNNKTAGELVLETIAKEEGKESQKIVTLENHDKMQDLELNQKWTKKRILEKMLGEQTIASNPLYNNFITHELELLNKKSAKNPDGTKKLTKSQIDKKNQDSALLEQIVDILDDLNGSTIRAGEIVEQLKNENVKSQQKATYLLKLLVEQGRAEKITDKKGRVSYKAVESEE